MPLAFHLFTINLLNRFIFCCNWKTLKLYGMLSLSFNLLVIYVYYAWRLKLFYSYIILLYYVTCQWPWVPLVIIYFTYFTYLLQIIQSRRPGCRSRLGMESERLSFVSVLDAWVSVSVPNWRVSGASLLWHSVTGEGKVMRGVTLQKLNIMRNIQTDHKYNLNLRNCNHLLICHFARCR